MACVGCKDIIQEIILHEILGIESSDNSGIDPNQMVLEISGALVYTGDGDIVLSSVPLPGPAQ